MIESPFEMLELADGASVRFHVESWEEGRMTIHPPWRPGGKDIPVIRVHVPKADKPGFPHYWDLTSAKLVALIRPMLQRADVRELRYTITARGFEAKKTFEVQVERAPRAAALP